MKKALLFFICLLSALHAQTFGYGDLQNMEGFPMAGIGVRMRQQSHALDLSANICVWPSTPVYHGRALYMIYPRNGSFYLGGGFGIVKIFRNLSSSLEASLGYQWTGSYPVFLELNAIHSLYPIGNSSWLRTWPGLTFGLGF